jgi:hypothetical protein
MVNHRNHLSRYGTFRFPVILSSQTLRQTRQWRQKAMPMSWWTFPAIVCNGFQIINGSAAE